MQRKDTTLEELNKRITEIDDKLEDDELLEEEEMERLEKEKTGLRAERKAIEAKSGVTGSQ